MNKRPEWKAIKNGRGEIKGWILMFWSSGCGWVTIPGESKYRPA